MGKYLLVLVVLVLLILGTVLASLSNKQNRAVEKLSDRKYENQARQISNSYAQKGISELVQYINTELEPNISSLLAPLKHHINLDLSIHNGEDIFNIDNSLVNLYFIKDLSDIPTTSYTLNDYLSLPNELAPHEYLICSVAQIITPQGNKFSTVTNVVYYMDIDSSGAFVYRLQSFSEKGVKVE
jgi:hypothetical protein